MKNKKALCQSFWKLARNYLHSYMPDVLNRSPKSIEAYKNALYIYLNFLKEKYNVENEQITFDYFKVENLTAFIAWMKQEKVYKPKTINLRMTAIRSFLKYCALQDLELKDLSYCANSIPDVKVPKRPIEFLTEDAIKAILSATSYDKPIHRRNRMLIILMYDTGARVSELSGAMLSSLHLKAKNPYIVLHGKGDKTRNVPLMEKTMLHLAEYLKEFHDERSDAPLFYCRHDGIKHNLSNDSIETILKNVAAKARETCNEVPERVYCHLIRKTRAMNLYKQKISLPIIAQLLGHESISTTSGFYAFATLDMMADAMKTANEHAALPEKEWKNAEIMNLLYTLD